MGIAGTVWLEVKAKDKINWNDIGKGKGAKAGANYAREFGRGFGSVRLSPNMMMPSSTLRQNEVNMASIGITLSNSITGAFTRALSKGLRGGIQTVSQEIATQDVVNKISHGGKLIDIMQTGLLAKAGLSPRTIVKNMAKNPVVPMVKTNWRKSLVGKRDDVQMMMASAHVLDPKKIPENELYKKVSKYTPMVRGLSKDFVTHSILTQMMFDKGLQSQMKSLGTTEGLNNLTWALVQSKRGGSVLSPEMQRRQAQKIDEQLRTVPSNIDNLVRVSELKVSKAQEAVAKIEQQQKDFQAAVVKPRYDSAVQKKAIVGKEYQQAKTLFDEKESARVDKEIKKASARVEKAKRDLDEFDQKIQDKLGKRYQKILKKYNSPALTDDLTQRRKISRLKRGIANLEEIIPTQSGKEKKHYETRLKSFKRQLVEAENLVTKGKLHDRVKGLKKELDKANAEMNAGKPVNLNDILRHGQLESRLNSAVAASMTNVVQRQFQPQPALAAKIEKVRQEYSSAEQAMFHPTQTQAYQTLEKQKAEASKTLADEQARLASLQGQQKTRNELLGKRRGLSFTAEDEKEYRKLRHANYILSPMAREDTRVAIGKLRPGLLYQMHLNRNRSIDSPLVSAGGMWSKSWLADGFYRNMLATSRKQFPFAKMTYGDVGMKLAQGTQSLLNAIPFYRARENFSTGLGGNLVNARSYGHIAAGVGMLPAIGSVISAKIVEFGPAALSLLWNGFTKVAGLGLATTGASVMTDFNVGLKALGVYGQVEAQRHRLEAVGWSEDNLKNLDTTLRKSAVELPVNIEDAWKSAWQMQTAGYSESDIIKAVPEAMKGAVALTAEGVSIEEVTRRMTDLLQATHTPLSKFGEMLDYSVAASSKVGMSWLELSNAFESISSTGESLGIGFKELTTDLTILNKTTGLRGQKLGTTFRSATTNIRSHLSDEGFLNQLGVGYLSSISPFTISEYTGKERQKTITESLREAMNMMIANGLGEATASRNLSIILGARGMQAGNVVWAEDWNQEKAERIVREALDTKDKLAEASMKGIEGLGAHIKSKWNIILYDIGEKLAEAFEASREQILLFVDTLGEKLAPVFDKIANSLKQIDWESLGTHVADALGKFMDVGASIDFEKVAEGLSNFSEVFMKLAELTTAAVEKIAGALKYYDNLEQIEEDVAPFRQNAEFERKHPIQTALQDAAVAPLSPWKSIKNIWGYWTGQFNAKAGIVSGPTDWHPELREVQKAEEESESGSTTTTSNETAKKEELNKEYNDAHPTKTRWQATMDAFNTASSSDKQSRLNMWLADAKWLDKGLTGYNTASGMVYNPYAYETAIRNNFDYLSNIPGVTNEMRNAMEQYAQTLIASNKAQYEVLRASEILSEEERKTGVYKTDTVAIAMDKAFGDLASNAESIPDNLETTLSYYQQIGAQEEDMFNPETVADREKKARDDERKAEVKEEKRLARKYQQEMEQAQRKFEHEQARMKHEYDMALANKNASVTGTNNLDNVFKESFDAQEQYLQEQNKILTSLLNIAQSGSTALINGLAGSITNWHGQPGAGNPYDANDQIHSNAIQGNMTLLGALANGGGSGMHVMTGQQIASALLEYGTVNPKEIQRIQAQMQEQNLQSLYEKAMKEQEENMMAQQRWQDYLDAISVGGNTTTLEANNSSFWMDQLNAQQGMTLYDPNISGNNFKDTVANLNNAIIDEASFRIDNLKDLNFEFDDTGIVTELQEIKEIVKDKMSPVMV